METAAIDLTHLNDPNHWANRKEPSIGTTYIDKQRQVWSHNGIEWIVSTTLSLNAMSMMSSKLANSTLTILTSQSNGNIVYTGDSTFSVK